MSKSTENATMITEFSDFYRAMGPQGQRFYAATSENRAKAIDYHNGMPDNVKGYAVYDTTIASDYAVALYADKASAMLHAPSAAPHAPEEAVEDDEVFGEDDDPQDFTKDWDEAEEIDDFDDPLDDADTRGLMSDPDA